MSIPWNPTSAEWSDILLEGARPEAVANGLIKRQVLPWTDTLLQFTSDSETVLDLGSGRGDHSAVLALNGRKTTVLDWSMANLDFSSQLFDALNLEAHFCRADITKPLPFQNNCFDTVFSCGVFEYFGSEEKQRIIQEMFRISRKRVIVMVPNALSLAYRIGMAYMKRKGLWNWGGEVPSYSLKSRFRGVENIRISEFSVAARHSLEFLKMPKGKTVKNILQRILRLQGHSRPALLRQGYLLVTVGEKF